MTTGAPTSDHAVGFLSRPVSPEHLDRTLARFARVSFRAKFHLRARERAYVTARDLDTIRRHVRELFEVRLSAAQPHKDGRQNRGEGTRSSAPNTPPPRAAGDFYRVITP